MLALLLLACGGDPVDIPVMEGFSYDWDHLNHRLSFLQGGIFDGEADLAVIGGTSTTGVDPALPDTCDPDTCQEFPFLDSAVVTLGWGQLSAKRIGVGTAEAELYADAAGVSTTVSVPLDDPEDAVVAVIQGITLNTNHALSDGEPSCYNPAYGWHPREIAVSMGAPVPGNGVATVDVSAAFAAGNSLEEERACIDLVSELATVNMTVQVAVLTGKLSATAQKLDQSDSYSYGTQADPDEQPDPDPSTRPLDGDPTTSVFAWSALDFQFHVGDPDDRGAYLRSLSWMADADAGTASGHATNYSPGTQLSAFDYAFTGTVQAISADDDTVTRGQASEDLPAALDDNGNPVVTTEPISSN